MPKSKRNKVVSLTKTDSKTKESKSKLIDKVTECLSSSFLHPLNPRCHSRIKQIRTSIDSNPHLYLIHIANDRNEHLQALRTTLKAEHAGSCMFLGKNRVMAKAVGVTVEEEYAPRLRMMGERLKGKVGLLSSGLGRDEVSRILSIHTASDFARGGCKATRTLILPEGPLRRLVEPLSHTDLVGGLDGDEEDYFKAAGVDAVNAGAEVIASFPGTMETQLRGLGLPTLLQGGVIRLMRPHTLCTKGQRLTPEQAQALKLFNIQMATFEVSLLAHWQKGGVFESLMDNPAEDEAGAGAGTVGAEGKNVDEAMDDDEEMDGGGETNEFYFK